ncbi:MAG TPA: DoxX family protein [Gemmataceae bacterium]|nr:DoxX family protein [Gemmataceae bacterium]
MLENTIKNIVAPLLLRLALAAVFLYHGVALVSQEMGFGWNPGLPRVVQALVAWGQLLGGAAMVIGFLTRLAAAGLIVIMVGAIALVHWPYGFSLPKGYEYNVVLILICLVLVLTGPGKLAVDHWLRLRLQKG